MTPDEEIDLLLGEGEDTFTFAGLTVLTELMEHDTVQGESADAAGVICGEGSVMVRASLFPDLKTGDAVHVNGDPYTVARKMRIQDGKVLQVFLGVANG